MVWLVALVATPVVFEVVFFGSIGPIWQGRYSISLWLGGAALVMSATPDSAASGPAARQRLSVFSLSRLGVAVVAAVRAVGRRSTGRL